MTITNISKAAKHSIYMIIYLLLNGVTDLGKVLLHPSFGGLPQWAVVGELYILVILIYMHIHLDSNQ